MIFSCCCCCMGLLLPHTIQYIDSTYKNKLKTKYFYYLNCTSMYNAYILERTELYTREKPWKKKHTFKQYDAIYFGGSIIYPYICQARKSTAMIFFFFLSLFSSSFFFLLPNIVSLPSHFALHPFHFTLSSSEAGGVCVCVCVYIISEWIFSQQTTNGMEVCVKCGNMCLLYFVSSFNMQIHGDSDDEPNENKNSFEFNV